MPVCSGSRRGCFWTLRGGSPTRGAGPPEEPRGTMPPVLPKRWRFDWPYLLLAAACVIPLYWPSLRYDLFQDDYYLLRPWPPEHLIQAWYSGWFLPEARDFYRPFAIWLYKALFYPFGLNTRVLHILPFVVLTTLAWMVGRFVRRESSSLPLGAVAVILTVVHPMVTVAAGGWVANQYQALVGIGMMASLLWWQTCRDKPWTWWWPMVIPMFVAGFTKETGLMIPLIVAAIHAGRAGLMRDLAWPSCRWCLPVLVLVFVGFNGWRWWVLGGAGSYGGVVASDVVDNFFRGPWATLFEPVRILDPSLPKWLFAGPCALAVAAALWALLRRAPVAGSLALAGVVILVAMSVPTAFVFSRDRLMPHPVGAVLLLTSGILVAARQRPVVRWGAGTTAVVGLGAALVLTTTALARFEPCRSEQLGDPNSLLLEQRTVPPEMIRWLTFLQRNGCNSDTHAPLFRATQRLTWGVIEQDGHLATYERRHVWVRPRIVALLDQRAVQVIVRVRHPLASPTNLVPLLVVADGGATFTAELNSPEWRDISVPLARTLLTWTRQMHRLELTIPESFLPGVEMRPLDLIYPK